MTWPPPRCSGSAAGKWGRGESRAAIRHAPSTWAGPGWGCARCSHPNPGTCFPEQKLRVCICARFARQARWRHRSSGATDASHFRRPGCTAFRDRCMACRLTGRDGGVHDFELAVAHGLVAQRALARSPLEALRSTNEAGGGRLRARTAAGVCVHRRQAGGCGCPTGAPPEAPRSTNEADNWRQEKRKVRGWRAARGPTIGAVEAGPQQADKSSQACLHDGLAHSRQQALVHFGGQRVVQQDVGAAAVGAKGPDGACAEQSRARTGEAGGHALGGAPQATLAASCLSFTLALRFTGSQPGPAVCGLRCSSAIAAMQRNRCSDHSRAASRSQSYFCWKKEPSCLRLHSMLTAPVSMSSARPAARAWQPHLCSYKRRLLEMMCM